MMMLTMTPMIIPIEPLVSAATANAPISCGGGGGATFTIDAGSNTTPLLVPRVGAVLAASLSVTCDARRERTRAPPHACILRVRLHATGGPVYRGPGSAMP